MFVSTNTQERTTGLLFYGSQQQPKKTTTHDEVRSSWGQQHSGVATYKQKKKKETGRRFSFAVRLLEKLGKVLGLAPVPPTDAHFPVRLSATRYSCKVLGLVIEPVPLQNKNKKQNKEQLLAPPSCEVEVGGPTLHTHP